MGRCQVPFQAPELLLSSSTNLFHPLLVSNVPFIEGEGGYPHAPLLVAKTGDGVVVVVELFGEWKRKEGRRKAIVTCPHAMLGFSCWTHVHRWRIGAFWIGDDGHLLWGMSIAPRVWMGKGLLREYSRNRGGSG